MKDDAAAPELGRPQPTIGMVELSESTHVALTGLSAYAQSHKAGASVSRPLESGERVTFTPSITDSLGHGMGAALGVLVQNDKTGEMLEALVSHLGLANDVMEAAEDSYEGPSPTTPAAGSGRHYDIMVRGEDGQFRPAVTAEIKQVMTALEVLPPRAEYDQSAAA